MGSIITDGMSSPRRYGARGSGKTGTGRKSFDRGGNYRNTTGTGSSSRRTDWGEVLSKKWENRMTRDPDSSEAHNIDAIRKHNVLQRLGITSQGRMNRLKQALTHSYGDSSDVSYKKAKTLDQKRWDSYNTGTELKYKEEYVPKRKK